MRKVVVSDKRRVYEGFLSVDEVTVRTEAPDGSMSEPMRRVYAERGDSVAVVVTRADTGNLLFVRQFRVPMIRHGETWLLEIVAGAIDADESPEQAAVRELEEELGYRATSLRMLHEMYGSPGGFSEKVTIYHAEVAPENRVSPGGGVEGEGEEVEEVELTVPEVSELVRQGEIRDAKTLIGLYALGIPRHP